MTRHVVSMELEEADHYTEAEKAAIRASMPEHERDAREKGIPVLGSGAVFPLARADVECKPFEIPEHWYQIGGLDVGWDHPTAAVRMVIDRDSGEKFFTHEYRQSKRTPLHHAQHMKQWGDTLPWAWPADALSRGKDGGEPLKEQYEDHGLEMLPLHAQLPNGSTSIEAGIMRMLEDFETGLLRVFSTLEGFFEEYGLYHRKDGRIVAELDDLMSAARYAYVMERFAEQIRQKAYVPIKPRARL